MAASLEGLARSLALRAVPSEYRDTYAADIDEMYAFRERRVNTTHARKWLRAELLRSVPAFALLRLRRLRPNGNVAAVLAIVAAVILIAAGAKLMGSTPAAAAMLYFPHSALLGLPLMFAAGMLAAAIAPRQAFFCVTWAWLIVASVSYSSPVFTHAWHDITRLAFPLLPMLLGAHALRSIIKSHPPNVGIQT